MTGSSQFTDDNKPKELCFLGFVRSPYAHALIRGTDFTKATRNEKFVSAISGEDIRNITSPIFSAQGQRATGRMYLALDKTVFVGEPVVAFLSKDRYALEDIAEEIEVEYEPLPPVDSVRQAKASKNKVYAQWSDNVAASFAIRKGDPEAAMKSSSYSAEVSLGIKRQAGVPMEPRCVIASYESENGRFHVLASVQSAHRLRNYLSTELGLPERFHVLTKDVGGGFGTKGVQSYPEAGIACIFAKKTGLYVKWSSTRTEDLLETSPGRDEFAKVEIFCDSNARMTALKARVEGDVGVFGSLNVSMNNTLKLMPGVYKIPNLDLKGTCYVTNKTAVGPVRGAGRPEACFFIERIVDLMARKLSLDPVEFRKRNLIQPGDIPFENGTGYTYDSGNFPLLLDKLVSACDYEGLKKLKSEKRGKEQKKLFGVGLALSIDDTGVHRVETAKIAVSTEGAIVLFTGSSPHGQGLETTLAQICSEELDLPTERIKVAWGDTDKLSEGFGTYGSRSTAIGGSAVIEACNLLKAEMLHKASEILGIESTGVKFAGGNFVSATQEVLLNFEEFIRKNGALEVSSRFELKSFPFAGGAHLCALSVDVETGKIEIEKYVVVDDCGKIINSTIVDGQIHGAVLHGIGGTLLEELVYDEEGQPLSTNLMSYLIPTASDSVRPEIFHVEFPSPLTLNGAKGVGETATIGAYPAIFNALDDALSQVGASLNTAPATPESVFRAIHSSQMQ